jgi:hypothetical protein
LLLWLVLHILLVLLVLLLLRLLISHPRKGRIPIIFPVSRLTCTLLLHHISDALLLTPGSTVISAAIGLACSLLGRHISADTLVADILVALAGIPLNNCLLSGDCRIIHLDLVVPANRGHTSGTPGAWMRGRGLAPRPRVGTSHRCNVLGCAGTWIRFLKSLLLLGSFRQKLVKPDLLLT